MKIAATYSHLGGQEFLSVRKPAIWAELVALIEAVGIPANPPIVASTDERITPSADFSAVVVQHLQAAGWEESPWLEGRVGLAKDRVALAVGRDLDPSKYSEFWAKHLALYLEDRIDVGVEILPVEAKALSASSASFESTIRGLSRQVKGFPAVPLLIVGIGL